METGVAASKSVAEAVVVGVEEVWVAAVAVAVGAATVPLEVAVAVELTLLEGLIDIRSGT